MNPGEKSDIKLFDIDWTEFEEDKRLALNEKYESFLESHRTSVFLTAVHGSDMRCLFTMMLICFIFGISGFENKTILMAIVGIQLIFSAMSRIALGGAKKELEEKRDELLQSLKRLVP